MTQQAIFPMKYVNITQKWGSPPTHVHGYPIDIAGKDTGINDAYAPFDGTIKRYWPNGNTVWLESSAKVRFADGTLDYAVVMLTHDNNIGDLKVGQKVKQGHVFYQEGTAGNANGNHVHFECGRGRFRAPGWHQEGDQWVIDNAYRPDKMLVLTDSNVVVNTQGLKFKREEEEMTEQDKKDLALGRAVRKANWKAQVTAAKKFAETIARLNQHEPWLKKLAKIAQSKR